MVLVFNEIKSLEVMYMFNRRNKIILHNNYCILETVAFYENILLDDIIKPFFFNDNYNRYPDISELIEERLSFMDRFKIVKKIAKKIGVSDFKKVDAFIKLRNKIAHNLSSVSMLDVNTKENEIILGGETTTWSNYLVELRKWADISYEMANFVKDVFDAIHSRESSAIFMYCKVEGDCVLIQNNLIYPEPKGKYTSFFKSDFDMSLIQYMREESECQKEVESGNK